MSDLADEINAINERSIAKIAEKMNGGEFRNGQWYTEGQRALWIKVVGGALRQARIDALEEAAANVALRFDDERIADYIRALKDKQP